MEIKEIESYLNNFKCESVTISPENIIYNGIKLDDNIITQKTGVYNSFLKHLKISHNELYKYKPEIRNVVVNSFLPKAMKLVFKEEKPYCFRKRDIVSTPKILEITKKLEEKGFNEVIPVEGANHDNEGQKPYISFRFTGEKIDLFPGDIFENSLELLFAVDSKSERDLSLFPAFVKESCTNVLLSAKEMKQGNREEFLPYMERIGGFWAKIGQYMKQSASVTISNGRERLSKIISSDFLKSLDVPETMPLFNLINELTLKAQRLNLDNRRRIEVMATRILMDIYEGGKAKKISFKEILLG